MFLCSGITEDARDVEESLESTELEALAFYDTGNYIFS
jgi:hypothetical protein